MRSIPLLAATLLLTACGGEDVNQAANDQAMSAEAAAQAALANLEGSSWELLELTVLGGHVFEPEDPADYTLRFLSDNRVRGKSDCNTINGNWSTDEAFALSGISSSRSLCLAGSLHNYYLLYLRDVVGMEQRNDAMVLTTSDSDVNLTFRKVVSN